MDTTSQSYVDVRQFRDALAAGKAIAAGKGLLKGLDTKLVKADQPVDGGALTATFILSTPAIDSYGDIIDQKGWNLTRYAGNTVVLWGHNASAPPVGKCIKIWLDGDALMGMVEFTPKEVSAFGYMIGQMVKGGFLSAVSVGFYPDDYEWNKERGGVDFKKQTLLEFSVVSIPANPEALLVDEKELKSLEGSLATFKAAGGDVSPLVSFAESLHALPAMEAAGLKAFDGMVQRVAKAPAAKSSEPQVRFVVTASAGKAAADVAMLLRSKGLAFETKDDGGDGTGDDMESMAVQMTKCMKAMQGCMKDLGDQTAAHKANNAAHADQVKALGEHVKAMTDGNTPASDATPADPAAPKAPAAKDAAAAETKGGAPHKLSKKNAADLALAKKAIADIDARHTGDSADATDEGPAADPAAAPADGAAKAALAPVVKAPTTEEIAAKAAVDERNALVAKLAATVKQKGDLITQMTGKVMPRGAAPKK